MKIIGKALGLLLAALNVAACGDLIETTDNGRLGGNWLLTTVDTLATGGVADVHTDRKFMAVEGGILQLRDADEGKQYIFRYSYVDDKLTLSDARVNDRERGILWSPIPWYWCHLVSTVYSPCCGLRPSVAAA